MAVRTDLARAARTPAALPVEQLYVTHCLYGQGLQREAGFGVRAASTTDPLLLRFAQEYPPHELPPGPSPEAGTIRRLALLRIPAGPTVLLHSQAVPAERHGRDNDFFTHLLVLPSLGPREALATWNSSGWATDYPPDGDRELPPLGELPRPGPLDDCWLTTFLQPTLTVDDPLVLAGLCPERLVPDEAGRRALLGRFLQGCLLALQAPPGAARGRLYVLAEPGLVALLLYGAARLLPPSLAAGLTFSTHEGMRRSLWSYRHALVVGTCPGTPAASLDDSFFTTRGFALDTFSGRCSAELEAGHEPAVREWVELAARDEWKIVDRVYALLGRGAAAVASFQEGLEEARLARRLVNGKADGSDLRALRDASWAPAVLAEHGERVLPLLREASVHDAALPEGFAGVLPEHATELERQLAEALHGNPPGDWLGPWRLLRAAWQDQPARLLEALRRALPAPPYPPGLRFALLREPTVQELCGGHRQPLHTLLRRCCVAELLEFGPTGLPREWYAWALCYALVAPETRAEAVRLVLAEDDELLRTFWKQLALVREEEQRQAILEPLLGCGGPGVLFLSRSLRSRAALGAWGLDWVLRRLNVWERDWREFWARDEHLGLLLEQLLAAGPEALPLWDGLLGLLDTGLLLGDDPFPRVLLAQLIAARDRAGQALPAGGARRINDWAVLCDHFEAASAVPAGRRPPIIDAYQRLGLDPIELLRRYFERFLLAQEASADLIDDFAGFFHSFYPEAASTQDHASRLFGWLDVVRVCADEARRALYQGHYLEHWTPAPLRQRLAEEARLAGKLLPEALQPAPLPPVSVPAPAAVARLDEAPPAQAAGFLWLLVSLAGGFVAALVFGLGALPAKQVAILAPFLPLVVGLAEGAALQAGVLAGPARRGWRILLLGILAAVAGGGVAALGALAQALAMPVVLWLGVTVAAGMLAGVAAGLAIPLLMSVPGPGRQLRAGPVARALAGVAATGAFVALARVLLR